MPQRTMTVIAPVEFMRKPNSQFPSCVHDAGEKDVPSASGGNASSTLGSDGLVADASRQSASTIDGRVASRQLATAARV